MMALTWQNFLVIAIFALATQLNVSGEMLSSDIGNPLNYTDEGSNLPTLKRGKRYLDFTKGSRMSWRTTVKNNILKINTLWGYGFGFRANFPFADKADRRRPFFKRDVFQSLTDVLDGTGLDGQACMLKSFCTAHLDAESEFSSGMLFKLLKYIFTLRLTLLLNKTFYFFLTIKKQQKLNKNLIVCMYACIRILIFKPNKFKMVFSVNGCVLLVGVALAYGLLHSYTTTSLVRASLLVAEQASSTNNITDKEIAFISLNGNLPNGNKLIATTKQAGREATTTVSPSKSEPFRDLKRGKRYLDLLNTSRMFLRVNAKNNIVPSSAVWAHGYGFRCNYPIVNQKRVRPFRRDTYETLGDLIEKTGFDGKACILKAFCTAHMNQNFNIYNGMLLKLLKYIFTLSDDDKRHFPYLKHENCRQILHSHCPLSFNNISPYTDDV